MATNSPALTAQQGPFDWSILGFPIAFLLIAIATFIFVGLEIKKKRLEIKEIIAWLILNTLFTTIIIYVLVVGVVKFYHPSVINAFDWLGVHAFHLTTDSEPWIILLIFGFIAFILLSTMINTVRVQRMNKRIDALNREVAILSGKVNKSADFSKFELAENEKTFQEIKQELREEVKIAKARKKAKEKIKELQTTQTVELKVKSKSKPKAKNNA